MLLKKKATNKCDVVLDVRNAITFTVKNNSVTIFEEKTLTIDRKSQQKLLPLLPNSLASIGRTLPCIQSAGAGPKLDNKGGHKNNITSQEIEGLRF